MKKIPRKPFLCLLLLPFFLSGCHHILRSEAATTVPKEELKLSTSVTPTGYTLALDLSPKVAKYTGQVAVDVDVLEPQSELVLHAKGLTLVTASLLSGDREWQLTVKPHTNGRIRLRNETTIPKGKYTIRMQFSGQITDTPDGLYRVRDGNGDYIFSQFEPISARTAFPCFDEPRFKTPFRVSVRVPKDNLVVSNGPELKRTATDTHTTFEFKKTRPLPTYLVAFGVGPLEVVQAPDLLEGTVPFRIVVPRGKAKLTAFAIRETPAIHETMKAYLDSGYPYQKLDFMAVPNFRAGAMENAGLVTFREALLLVDESKVDGRRLRSIRSVIAHELAHMWFGNSLTLEWWDDIWLNEAFATWMADRVNIELGDAEAFRRSIARSKQRVMRLDSKANVRVIRQPIKTEGDIENAFDGITYRKGAAVLWMIERWLGEDTMKSALRTYVKTYAHQAVNTDDLMKVFDQETKKRVTQMSSNFLNERGLPKLKFDLECQTNRVTTLKIEQETSRIRNGRKLPWRVPVCVRYGSATQSAVTCFELEDLRANVRLATPSCPNWFYGNADESGYYAWSVSEGWLKKLLRNLSALTSVEKSAIAARLRRRAEAGDLGLLDYVTALLSLLKSELYAVKSEAVNNLTALAPALSPTLERRAEFYRWLGTHLLPIWSQLSETEVPSDDVDAVRFRDRVRQLLAFEAKNTAILSTSLARLRVLLEQPSAEWTTEDRQLLVIGALTAKQTDWNRIRDRLKDERDAPNKAALIRALVSVPDAALRRQARSLFEDGAIEAQNFWLVARGLGWRDREERWQWLFNSMPMFEKRLTGGGVANLPWLGAGYCTAAKANEMEAFFSTHLLKHSAMRHSLDLSKEYIAECVALRKLWATDASRVLKIVPTLQ